MRPCVNCTALVQLFCADGRYWGQRQGLFQHGGQASGGGYSRDRAAPAARPAAPARSPAPSGNQGGQQGGGWDNGGGDLDDEIPF